MLLIRLETERGEEIKSIVDREDFVYRSVNKKPQELSHLHLWKYIDPHSNTVFNSLQMKDLLSDLNMHRDSAENETQKQFVDDLSQLIETLDVHEMLKFIGG